jgi:hypothetical protein
MNNSQDGVGGTTTSIIIGQCRSSSKETTQNLCYQGRMVTLCWFQSWGHLGKDEKREKLKKLGKKKSLLANWEVFVGYQDGKGN